MNKNLYDLLLLILLTLLLSPPKYDEEKLPYRVHWGAYTVEVAKASQEQFAPERVRILDAQGRVVREIHDQRIDQVEFVELDGKPQTELHVDANTGGAHCCETDYYFTQHGGLRNLLIFDGGNGSVDAIKALSKGSRPQIIASSDVLAYFDGLSYADSPGVKMVIGWDGKRYVDQTRLYPGPVQKNINDYRNDFLRSDKERPEAREEVRRMGAAGYYANMAAIGRGKEARAWLLKRMPPSTRQWFVANERDLLRLVAASPGKIRVSQERILAPHP